MTVEPATLDHPVFLLAEHLDQILAAGEDLLACRPRRLPSNPQRVATRRPSLVNFVRELSRHEMIAMVRVLRARDLTRALVRRDKRFAIFGGLFVGGTAMVDEVMNELATPAQQAFETGNDPVAYLRCRGIIDTEAAGVDQADTLAITGTFRLGGLIELGPLMDLTAGFLDALEVHYDLFPDLEATAALDLAELIPVR